MTTMPTDTSAETEAAAESDGTTVFTVTYADETATYELIMSGMTFAEARALEKVSGITFTQLMKEPALRGSATVLQALIWISMKRKFPTLTFTDIDDIAIDAIEWPDSPAKDTTQDDDATGDEVGPTSAADAAHTDDPVDLEQ